MTNVKPQSNIFYSFIELYDGGTAQKRHERNDLHQKTTCNVCKKAGSSQGGESRVSCAKTLQLTDVSKVTSSRNRKINRYGRNLNSWIFNSQVLMQQLVGFISSLKRDKFFTFSLSACMHFQIQHVGSFDHTKHFTLTYSVTYYNITILSHTHHYPSVNN